MSNYIKLFSKNDTIDEKFFPIMQCQFGPYLLSNSYFKKFGISLSKLKTL